MEVKKKKNLWNFVDSLEGDKVVWMIVLLLILVSIVAIFSSTSQLTLKGDTSRLTIIKEQMFISLLGLGVIIICYNIRSIGFFRVLSQLGFAGSLFLLIILVIGKPVGPFKPQFINQAWRTILVGGFQVHVFEVVKVAMIMYLAWAVNAYKNDKFFFANLLAKKYPFFGKDLVKKVIYIYFPIFITSLCIMRGSLSSTIFIGGMMFVTILIGGIKVKELFIAGAVALVVLVASIGINSASNKPAAEKPFPHLAAAMKRFDNSGGDLKIVETKNPGDEGFQEALDKVKQPMSARIAIHQGGLFGKGPGRSTQRYIVPIMFEDYMFSFIVEEYGLFGGIFILFLYISLIARGSIIVRNCDNSFAKTAVAGLVILISGQAMMHILVNCDVGLLTGQTLPMVSFGNSAFLMFSLAFGIILSISKMAKKKIEMEVEGAEPIVDHKEHDEVVETLNDLDDMENDGEN